MTRHGNRVRTRLDRETAFVDWVCTAREEKLHERSVAELARDYAVPVELVKYHLALRLGKGALG